MPRTTARITRQLLDYRLHTTTATASHAKQVATLLRSTSLATPRATTKPRYPAEPGRHGSWRPRRMLSPGTKQNRKALLARRNLSLGLGVSPTY